MGGLILFIVIAGDFFLPPPGIPLFSILYFGSKILIWILKVDFWTIALLLVSIFSIFYMIAVKLPIFTGKSLHRGIIRMENAVKKMISHSKKYGAGFVLLLSFFSFIVFGVSITEFSDVNLVLSSAFISFLPLFLIAFFNSSSESEVTSTSGTVATTEGRQNRRSLNQRQPIRTDGGESEDNLSLIPEPLINTATKFKDTLMMNDMDNEEAFEHASDEVLNKAKKVSKAKIIPFLIVGIIVMAVQWLILVTAAIGYINLILPMAASTLYGPLGLAEDYAFAADQGLVASYAPEIGLDEEIMALREAGATASCFAQGPACMAEWRQNNTVQPGSEAVGQEYRLEVSDFVVEGGGTLDVANRRANYPLTSRLVIENSRYGLRGITAENVTYEIGLEADGGITSEDGTLCSTGAVDLWSEDRDDFRDNNLPPGDAYQLTSFQRGQSFYQDNITLENCGLLQPGQIELSRSAFLDIVYDYSSRSTLEIDAMSEQNLQEMGIRRDFEESETADTPVKSFVNVYSPVIFERLDNRRVSTPFDVEVGFDTDDPEVKYNITSDSLRFRASRLTAPSALIDDPDVENTQAAIGQVDEINDRSCDLEPVEGEPHVYKPSEQALDDIQLMQDEGMFTYRRSPPTLSCSFQLINPDAISPSGETLIMDVEGDYTVEDREESEAFQVWNTGCRGNDCPLLVPEDLVEYSNADSDNFISTCSRSARADASGGCDVRYLPLSNTDEFDGDEWRTLRYDRGHNLGALLDESDSDFLSEMDIGEVSIESNLINTDSISTGDTAFTYAGLIKHLEDNIRDSDNMEVINIDTIGDHDSLPDEENQTSPYTAFGIDTSDRSTYEEIISEDSGFALEIRNNQLSISQTDDYCDEKEGEELLEAWEESNFGNPVFLAIETDRGECEDEHEFNRRTGGTNVGSP